MWQVKVVIGKKTYKGEFPTFDQALEWLTPYFERLKEKRIKGIKAHIAVTSSPLQKSLRYHFRQGGQWRHKA